MSEINHTKPHPLLSEEDEEAIQRSVQGLAACLRGATIEARECQEEEKRRSQSPEAKAARERLQMERAEKRRATWEAVARLTAEQRELLINSAVAVGRAEWRWVQLRLELGVNDFDESGVKLIAEVRAEAARRLRAEN